MNEKKRGRPRLSQEEKTVVVSVTVTESQAQFLETFGGGSRSQGVRDLVNAEIRTMQTWFRERYSAELEICHAD